MRHIPNHPPNPDNRPLTQLSPPGHRSGEGADSALEHVRNDAALKPAYPSLRETPQQHPQADGG